MHYHPRIVETEIGLKLKASGALLIKGPKSCGKTETAKQFAKSILQVDRDEQVPVVMKIIDTTKFTKPASLNIITGTGMSYTRPDGVNVISIASLGK
ncbi:MAG: hypothetical protein AB2L20_09740 [Mangrovibacterium sp.]